MAEYTEENAYWELLLRFHQFKGWRIVEANDGNGVRCQCLLLPMEQNGIVLTPDDRMLPFMKINCFPSIKDEGARRSGFFRMLYPVIPRSIREKLLEEGLAHEEDEYWARQVGGIRKKNWQETAPKYRGWHAKKKN